MYAFAVTVLIYLNHAMPWTLARPLLFLPIAALCILVLVLRNVETALELLFIILLAYVLSAASLSSIV